MHRPEAGTFLDVAGRLLVLGGALVRAALRAGFALSRSRILGSVLKSGSAPKQALESVSRGAWHCVAQHFQNAAKRNAKLPGRPILRPVGGHFSIYLCLGVYGHGVCLHRRTGGRGVFREATASWPRRDSGTGLSTRICRSRNQAPMVMVCVQKTKMVTK